MNAKTAIVAAPLQLPMSASEIQEQVNVIQKVMQQVMKKDVHYGTIPGCGKKETLFKPGAEKIMATFRLAADPEVTDLSTEDVIKYQVKVRITSPSGVFLGAGIGTCSTNEEKYKWRATYIQEEFDDTPESRRRIKYSQYKDQPVKKQNQIRTNPADLDNTVLKMAKKRGLVDGVLTVTAASDIFTQDIEDLPEELRTEDSRPNNAQPKQLQPYPDDKFEKNKDSWRKLIEGGTKTAQQVIASIQSRSTLTDKQRAEIVALVPVREDF